MIGEELEGESERVVASDTAGSRFKSVRIPPRKSNKSKS